MGKPRKTYSEEFRRDFVRRFQESEMPVTEFVEIEGVSYNSALNWIKKYSSSDSKRRNKNGPYTPEERRQAVEAYQKSGLTQEDFCKTWGLLPEHS